MVRHGTALFYVGMDARVIGCWAPTGFFLIGNVFGFVRVSFVLNPGQCQAMPCHGFVRFFRELNQRASVRGGFGREQ
jgi:hypothetical protein